MIGEGGSELELPVDVPARIEAAATDAIELYQLVGNLQLDAAERDGVLGRVAAAFDYHERFPGQAGDDYFGPMYELDGRRYPPPLADVPPDVSELWIAAADQIQAPIARARLNDLCFVAGWGNRGARARAAFDARLEAANALAPQATAGDRPLAEFARLGHLGRALTLARLVSDADRAQRAVEAILAAIDHSFDQPSPEPGITLGYIELLVDDAGGDHDVGALLARARKLYSGDFHNTAETINLQLRQRNLEDAARTALHRELVTNRLDQAEAEQQGLVKLVHLEAAIQLAIRYHQDDLRAEATSRLQQIGVEDLDLKETSVEFKVPTEKVEAHIAQFTDQPTWQLALLRLIASAPPSGITAENREHVANQAKIAVISSIFPRVQIGGDGLPRFTASTDEERAEYALVSHEMLHVQFTGTFLPEILDRIWQKWGPLTSDDLAEFFSESSHVEPRLARALARDFLRYFNGDHEGAAHTTSAHIETLVRDIVLAIPLPIYRVQRQQNPGQYPGLGTLLPALRAHGLDESWARFLEGFLAKPIGANTRNELLHGFELEPSESEAALVLIAALYLARGVILTPGSSSQPPDPPESQEATPS